MRYYERKNYKNKEFDEKNSNDSFVKQYEEYLRKNLEENIQTDDNFYHDIDSYKKGKIVDYVFYEDLCEFLNKQSMKIFHKKIFNIDDKKLHLKWENHDFIMKSDQFGFAAKDLVKKVKNFKISSNPLVKYTKYYNEYPDIYEKVSNYIYKTRTIGCSFIWPIGRENAIINNNSPISTYRGGNSYIEDCVDLTLLEIKQFYECLEKIVKDKIQLSDEEKNELKKQMKKKHNLLLKYNDANDVIDFLLIFKDFKTYVKFFQFEDFVNLKDETIIDILNDDVNSSNYTLNKEETIKKKKRIKNINNFKALEKILNNVQQLITRRSERINK